MQIMMYTTNPTTPTRTWLSNPRKDMHDKSCDKNI